MHLLVTGIQELRHIFAYGLSVDPAPIKAILAAFDMTHSGLVREEMIAYC